MTPKHVSGTIRELQWSKGNARSEIGSYTIVYEDWDDDPFWFVLLDGKAASRAGTHATEDADMKRCAGCGSVRDRRGMDCLEDGSWRCCTCTPSSAGTVSVEAAARVLLAARNPDGLTMLPDYVRDMLRALAGERG